MPKLPTSEITGVVGIDFSLRGCGVAALHFQSKRRDPNQFAVAIKTGVISEKDTTLLPSARASSLARKLRPWVSETTAVFIEEAAFSYSGAQARIIGPRAVVRYILWRFLKYESVDVGPGQIKKFLTGKGNSKKDLILMKCLKNYGMEFATSDEADAFGACLLGAYAIFGPPDKARAYELDTLAKFKRDSREFHEAFTFD